VASDASATVTPFLRDIRRNVLAQKKGTSLSILMGDFTASASPLPSLATSEGLPLRGFSDLLFSQLPLINCHNDFTAPMMVLLHVVVLQEQWVLVLAVLAV
tara:strand:- start:92 stop:394 length:303 start_codon:yes stop_codon:yes gene_type:complete